MAVHLNHSCLVAAIQLDKVVVSNELSNCILNELNILERTNITVSLSSINLNGQNIAITLSSPYS